MDLPNSSPDSTIDRLQGVLATQDMTPLMKMFLDVVMEIRSETAELAKRLESTLEENRKLREENIALKRKINSLSSARPTEVARSTTVELGVDSHNVTAVNSELKRSIVISGVPEF
ncbi:unnamed protein product [Heligmosomoides polygyrus]|uniref:Transposase n=1 Tax=Heligmosomoides polygyrus TaxID=6339 RepID=A0A183GA02_HELPZ|nr:unnamed protein product [Heligmosomoides polygyrus]